MGFSKHPRSKAHLLSFSLPNRFRGGLTQFISHVLDVPSLATLMVFATG